MRNAVARVPRLPPFTATRSTVLGFDSENFVQPPSSTPAVELVLNHTSCTVIHTCEYCAGVLPVADTSVRVEQPPSRHNALPSAAKSAADRRLFMQIPVRGVASIILRPRQRRNARIRRQLGPIVPAWPVSQF